MQRYVMSQCSQDDAVHSSSSSSSSSQSDTASDTSDDELMLAADGSANEILSVYDEINSAINQLDDEKLVNVLEEAGFIDINIYDNHHHTPLRSTLKKYLLANLEKRERLIDLLGILITYGAKVDLLEDDMSSLTFVLTQGCADEKLVRFLIGNTNEIPTLEVFKCYLEENNNYAVCRLFAKSFSQLMVALADEVPFLLENSNYPMLDVLAENGYDILLTNQGLSVLCHYFDSFEVVEINTDVLNTTRVLLKNGAKVLTPKGDNESENALDVFATLCAANDNDNDVPVGNYDAERSISTLLQRFAFLESKEQEYQRYKEQFPVIHASNTLAWLDQYFAQYYKLEVEMNEANRIASRNEFLVTALTYFQTEKILTNYELNFYILLQDLLLMQVDSELIITANRRGGKLDLAYDIPQDFTYLAEPPGFYVLPPGDIKRKIFSLLTSYLLELRQNAALNKDDKKAAVIKSLIAKLDPDFQTINAVYDMHCHKLSNTKKRGKKQKAKNQLAENEFFEIALRLYESYEGDFCAENLSADSDSVEEQRYQTSSTIQRTILSAHGRLMAKRAGADLLVEVNKSTQQTRLKFLSGQAKSAEQSKAGKRSYEEANFGYETESESASVSSKETKSKSSTTNINLKLHERFRKGVQADTRKIYRDEAEITPQIQKDFDLLNHLYTHGQLTDDKLAQIETKFFVAHYRGHHHNTEDFTQQVRRIERKMDKTQQPIYAKAVLTAEAESAEIKQLPKGSQDELQRFASYITDQLLSLRQSGAVSLPSIDGSSSYLFDNASLAQQDAYSKNYPGFHDSLRDKQALPGDERVAESISDYMYMHYINASNHYVSMGDIPRHALMYAYGVKYYEGQQESRLKPNWHRDGEIERPYMGEIFITLHSPLDLVKEAPHHVTSLNRLGKIHTSYVTNAEYETTFFGALPAGRVIGRHIVKYPSFKGPYKAIYQYKYGLSAELYQLFQEAIQTTTPNSVERQQAVSLLSEYLIAYLEVCLINLARIAAIDRKGVLIYRNEFGDLTLRSEPAVLNPQGKNEHDKAKQNDLRNIRQQASEVAQPKSGFLYDLNRQFIAYYYNCNDDSLLRSVYKTLLLNISYGDFVSQEQALSQEAIEEVDEHLVFYYKQYQASCLRKRETEVEQFFKHSLRRLILLANAYQCIFQIHDSNTSGTLEIHPRQINDSGKPIPTCHLYYMGGCRFAALLSRMTPVQAAAAVLPSTPPAKLPIVVTPKQASMMRPSFLSPPFKPAAYRATKLDEFFKPPKPNS